MSPMSGRPRTALSLTLAAVLCGGASGGVLVGCASRDTTAELHATRQAAIARWNRCIERETTTRALVLDAYREVDAGCEGHRRDVLKLFPPHMEKRIERMLEQREGAQVRAHLRTRASDEGLRSKFGPDAPERSARDVDARPGPRSDYDSIAPLIERLVETFPSD